MWFEGDVDYCPRYGVQGFACWFALDSTLLRINFPNTFQSYLFFSLALAFLFHFSIHWNTTI